MDGAQLPAKFEPFPADLLGKPIEELDQYVYEKVRKNGNATVVRWSDAIHRCTSIYVQG